MIDLHYWPTPNGKKVTILLEECGPRLESTGRDYAARIASAARRMDTLIRALLDFGRLDQTDVRLASQKDVRSPVIIVITPGDR